MIENAVIADLHIHSRFSRATSKDLSIENLEKWARVKGVDLLGTGDFQHPLWFKELNNLEERDGILYSKTSFPFVWQTEISLMYTQGRGRRVHFIILAPSREVAKQITKFLASKGRLDYDGRPIFGFNAVELVDEMNRINEDIEIIPSHCMTPWFGIFGSNSGFDSLKECFQDRADKIHSVESGMSADPVMLQHLSELNDKAILSFSDSHSFWPWRIARESTIFNLPKEKLSYKEIIKQIRENSILGTIETSPLYGKYHWDGHRLCKFSCSPEETKKLRGICPVCGKALTIGVENRVGEIGDQQPEENKNKKPYYTLLPLHELIALAKASTLSSRKTWLVYNKLIDEFGNEFNILLNAKREELAKFLPQDAQLIELILRNREGKMRVKAGYDGEYGVPLLSEMQKKLL